MKQTDTSSAVAIVAARLAAETASKAADLATSTSNTAVVLATKTAESMAIISTDISWMKQSLKGIEVTLKEMSGVYVTTSNFMELEKSTEDKEIRLRTLERNTNVWVGGLAVLTFAIPILLNIFLK